MLSSGPKGLSRREARNAWRAHVNARQPRGSESAQHACSHSSTVVALACLLAPEVADQRVPAGFAIVYLQEQPYTSTTPASSAAAAAALLAEEGRMRAVTAATAGGAGQHTRPSQAAQPSAPPITQPARRRRHPVPPALVACLSHACHAAVSEIPLLDCCWPRSPSRAPGGVRPPSPPLYSYM